jgi:hypothetical protein
MAFDAVAGECDSYTYRVAADLLTKTTTGNR